MNIAIVGLAPHYTNAPFGDEDWELWGLPWDAEYWAWYDRCFEMHAPKLLLEDKALPKDYDERLKGIERLYMQEKYYPNVTPYPLDEVRLELGLDYFNSSIAYMMALAIFEGANKIGIWGVDMDMPGERDYQRPNMEWLIGRAEGMGIDVFIPPESKLLTYGGYPNGACPERYGYL